MSLWSSAWGFMLVAAAVSAAPEIEFHPTLKLASLANHARDGADRDSWQMLGRLRLDTQVRTPGLDIGLAYEQRAQWRSDAAAGEADALPSEAAVPFRGRQLDWAISEDNDTRYRHEIDRAFLAFHPSWGELIIGRQAIGLGRGVVFSALDLFAPFSPLEADREWRRGVDALRLEYRLSATSSAELIGVLAANSAESAVLMRLRGYVGAVDAELIAGRRAQDKLIGTVLSATVGDAEVHGELALFDPREGSDKASLVVGSSYTFDVGHGLTIFADYHYSGLGVGDIDDLPARLAEVDFQVRISRGDLQILSKHGLGVQVAYPINADWNASLGLLSSPVDGSGVATPSIRWDASSALSALVTLYLPWGQRLDGRVPQSEYGGTATGLFVQLSLYY